MGALKIAVSALFLALLGPGVQAGAWKCQIDGKTVFSDVPCPEQGKKIDTTSGQTRGVTGLRQDMLREQARERQVQAEAARERKLAAAQPQPVQRDRNCPTALQIKNWETTLSAQLRASPDADAAVAGLKRAKWCAEGKDPDAETVRDAELDELAKKISRKIPRPSVTVIRP